MIIKNVHKLTKMHSCYMIKQGFFFNLVLLVITNFFHQCCSALIPLVKKSHQQQIWGDHMNFLASELLSKNLYVHRVSSSREKAFSSGHATAEHCQNCHYNSRHASEDENTHKKKFGSLSHDKCCEVSIQSGTPKKQVLCQISFPHRKEKSRQCFWHLADYVTLLLQTDAKTYVTGKWLNHFFFLLPVSAIHWMHQPLLINILQNSEGNRKVQSNWYNALTSWLASIKKVACRNNCWLKRMSFTEH